MLNTRRATPPLFLFFFLIMAFAPDALAQNQASLSGTVKSAATGEPLTQADALLSPGNQSTVSDALGKFNFINLAPGTYSITVHNLGYFDFNQKIILEAGQQKILDVELQSDVRLLEGVEITENAFQNRCFPGSLIKQTEIEKLPARDIGDFLRSEPNVNGIRKGGGNLDPVIRGLKFGQLNVQTNTGQKIEGGCPNRMDPAASHIDINDISRIEILKGPYTLRYGPNFGAVLNLVTQKARPFERFTMQVKAIKGWESNWNGNKEHLQVLGGSKRIYFALSGNHQDYGNYTAGNSAEVKSSFRKYNFSAELGLAPWKNHELRLDYKNSNGRDIRFPTLPMDERSDETQLYSATYRYANAATKLQSITAKVYRSEVNHEMDNKWRPFSDTVVAVSTIQAINTGGKADFGFAFGEARLHLGLDYENIDKDGQRQKSLIMQPGLPVKTEQLWGNAIIQNLGFFAEFVQQANPFLEWIFAARADYNTATSDPLSLKNMMGMETYHNDTVDSDFANVSLSGGLSYQISSELSVDFALGRGVRSPDMVERFIILLPVGYDDYDYLGNPSLKPENNHQADLTLKYICDRSGSFRLNGFYSYITQYISGVKLPPSLVMPQTQGVLGVKQFQNIDVAQMYGFEFVWISPLRFDWHVNLSTAYTAGFAPEATRYIIENSQVVGQETVKNDPLPELPPLEANLRLDYSFMDGRLVPQLHIRAVAKQNHISAAYDEMETAGFFTAGFNLNFRYSKNLSLAAGVNNIFDRAYYEHLNRRIIGSNAALYEPGRSFYLNLILNL